jgi:nicotinamide-nucleotide amidase
MIKASIISIGNELLNGQTVDTNSSYLSGRLLSIGIPTVSRYTVGDDIELIIKALKSASGDGDVILITGGLGPTDDDITRQGLAKFLGVELQLQDELLKKIRNYFVKRELEMPENNKIQAYLPAGAKALANNLGTAPGIMAETIHKGFYAMPGVPSEMKAMFEESVFTELKKNTSEQAIVVKRLKCFGAGESKIAEMMGNVMNRQRNPLINCTVQTGVVTLHIIATAKTRNQAEQMAGKDEEMLKELLGSLIYGTGEQNLAEVVGLKLAEKKKTIAVAESCTGGLLAKMLTDISGASNYFTYGWVTYNNEAKISQLGVPAELIDKYGAVSEKVAESMSLGAKKRAGTDYAIGITGIAGPTGGSKEKPVGLVYISVASDNNCDTKRFIFSHDRDFIRLRTAQTALNILRLKLCD